MQAHPSTRSPVLGQGEHQEQLKRLNANPVYQAKLKEHLKKFKSPLLLPLLQARAKENTKNI
jgi:hypothetical protein